ncbi:MAG: NACHT domain-containing protein [Chloroflexi bacterium]|nr:NACHT domain-containing protein [Chloroflexota bacterium]
MFQFPNFEFDRISFWIGFLAATIFWWLANRLKFLIPLTKDYIQQQREYSRQRSLAGIDPQVRQAIHLKAQRSHLAYELFPLNEILITPRLLMPIPYTAPEGSLPLTSLADEVIPYLPDWPEFTAEFPVTSLHPIEAMWKGQNIAIIGQPGSGKSVALASMAELLANHAPSAGVMKDHLPLLLHVHELKLPLPGGLDALEWLSTAMTRQLPMLVASRFPNYLYAQALEGKVVLFLDGLDELPPSELASAVEGLRKLVQDYPHVHVAVAASDLNVDGLLELGFEPLPLAAWSFREKSQFVVQWSQAWKDNIEPEIVRHANLLPIETILANEWLCADAHCDNPLEWTFKTWAFYAGDTLNPHQGNGFEAYIGRLPLRALPRQALEGLALEFVRQGCSSLTSSEIESFFSKFNLPVVPDTELEEVDEPVARLRNANGKDKKQPKQQKVSSSSRALNSLFVTGLISEWSDDRICFTQPAIAGYLAGKTGDSSLPELFADRSGWAPYHAALQMTATSGNNTAWALPFLQASPDPLHTQMMTAARWLKNAPESQSWRSELLKTLVELILDDNIPFGLRARFLAGLVHSCDANLALLFRQLFTSASTTVRRLAALGSGALGELRLVNDLNKLLSDPDAGVRQAACYALGAIQTSQSIKIVTDTLSKGDEGLRQAAAEILALEPTYGYDTIKNATESEDFLQRWAAVSGLTRIREAWAVELLHKMSIEDHQWVVRNAASHAFEVRQKLSEYIPTPLPAPAQAAWLIQYASKKGEGIPAQGPAIDLFLDVLKNGTIEERFAALSYLRQTPDPDVLAGIYQLFYEPSGALQEDALLSLWYIRLGGTELPTPDQFGIAVN